MNLEEDSFIHRAVVQQNLITWVFCGRLVSLAFSPTVLRKTEPDTKRSIANRGADPGCLFRDPPSQVSSENGLAPQIGWRNTYPNNSKECLAAILFEIVHFLFFFFFFLHFRDRNVFGVLPLVWFVLAKYRWVTLDPTTEGKEVWI